MAVVVDLLLLIPQPALNGFGTLRGGCGEVEVAVRVEGLAAPGALEAGVDAAGFWSGHTGAGSVDIVGSLLAGRQ